MPEDVIAMIPLEVALVHGEANDVHVELRHLV